MDAIKEAMIQEAENTREARQNAIRKSRLSATLLAMGKAFHDYNESFLANIAGLSFSFAFGITQVVISRINIPKELTDESDKWKFWPDRTITLALSSGVCRNGDYVWYVHLFPAPH